LIPSETTSPPIPSPGIKAEAYLWKAFYHYWIGEREVSLRTLKLASEQAEQVDNKFCQAYAAWIEGWIKYDRGDLDSYESLIQDYVRLVEKANQGDIHALAEYARVSAKAVALATKITAISPRLTDEQREKFEKLQQKYEEALKEAEENQ